MWKALFPYLRPYKKEAILGPLFKLVEAAVELLIPYLLARLIDEVLRGGELQQMTPYIVWMLALVVLGLLSTLACQWMAATCSQGFGTLLRERLLSGILYSNDAQLGGANVSTLTHRLIADVNQVQLAIAMAIRLLSRAPFLCLGAMLSAYWIKPIFALYLAVAVTISSVCLYSLMKLGLRYHSAVQHSVDRLSARARQLLKGLRLVRGFVREETELDLFERLNQRHRDQNRLAIRVLSALSPLTNVLFNLALVLFLWRGGLQVRSSDLSVGDWVALQNYALQVIVAMLVVANLAVLFSRAMSSGQRLQELLEKIEVAEDVRREKKAKEEGTTIPVEGSVPIKVEERREDDEAKKPSNGLASKASHDEVAYQLREVALRYPQAGEEAIQGLSFELKRGEHLAVIGPAASGKTTLLRLLLGLYSPTQGSLSFFGDAKPDLERLAYVPQKASFLEGNLLDNLLLGLKPAQRAKVLEDGGKAVWKALRLAEAEAFVREKAGLETPVLAKARNFSGGQKQRLALARALLRPADVLLLDDAFSALDALTIQRILRSLRQEQREQTIVLVSQKVPVAKQLDCILLLNAGRMEGLATHEVLRQASALYRQFCLLQEGE